MIEDELKQLIIDVLLLEDIEAKDIETGAPLFGDGLGLDSIDALELGVAFKKKYNVDIKSLTEEQIKESFYSVKTLVDLVTEYGKKND